MAESLMRNTSSYEHVYTKYDDAVSIASDDSDAIMLSAKANIAKEEASYKLNSTEVKKQNFYQKAKQYQFTYGQKLGASYIGTYYMGLSLGKSNLLTKMPINVTNEKMVAFGAILAMYPLVHEYVATSTYNNKVSKFFQKKSTGYFSHMIGASGASIALYSLSKENNGLLPYFFALPIISASIGSMMPEFDNKVVNTAKYTFGGSLAIASLAPLISVANTKNSKAYASVVATLGVSAFFLSAYFARKYFLSNKDSEASSSVHEPEKASVSSFNLFGYLSTSVIAGASAWAFIKLVSSKW